MRSKLCVCLFAKHTWNLRVDCPLRRRSYHRSTTLLQGKFRWGGGASFSGLFHFTPHSKFHPISGFIAFHASFLLIFHVLSLFFKFSYIKTIHYKSWNKPGLIYYICTYKTSTPLLSARSFLFTPACPGTKMIIFLLILNFCRNSSNCWRWDSIRQRNHFLVSTSADHLTYPVCSICNTYLTLKCAL